MFYFMTDIIYKKNKNNIHNRTIKIDYYTVYVTINNEFSRASIANDL